MNDEVHPGLYVHIPFCRSKCQYCDFYSVASSEAIPAWLQALEREALLYRGIFHEFDSLYLGGGTPTTLGERELSALMECLFKHFTFCPESEITIEANPEDLSKDKLKTIGALGINRISLGVQSLSDRDLDYLGRSHSAPQALKALDMLRSCGLTQVGVDLMYGLGIQTIATWKISLSRLLEFRPQHISCYQLTFEKGTPLGKMKAQGRVRAIGEKLERAFFVFTSRYLERRGYSHYEISNFAASRESMCRHNRKYWNHVPYLGLGPSAHSFHAGTRWWNVRSIKKYVDLLEKGKVALEASEVLSQEQLDLEALALGLRTSDGVTLGAAGGGLKTGKALEELKKAGLVRREDGRIKPTRKGFLVADTLPLMFYR